jgi:dTDP-4-dehydrorhamnose reductase
MRIAVTGTAGQLACSLRDAARSGQTLVMLGRPQLDLADAATIAPALDAAAPDLVVNAAAYTAVDRAESEPDVAAAVNAIAPGHIARWCAAHAVPLIHLSTDYVYDGRKPSPYMESDPTGPVSAYGRSKLAGEQAVADACPRHIIVRTAWVHSPYGANFTKTMLRLAATRAELGVVDDQQGNPTYAPHLAAAILGIAEQIGHGSDAAWGVYHAAGSGTTTWCGFAREIFAVSARAGGAAAAVKPITTAEYPTPARRPANSRLDCSKLSAAFGITLPDWREGVAECVARLASLDRAIRNPGQQTA